MSNEHRHESLAYLDDAKIAQIELDAVIADDFSSDRQKRIAGLHQEINLALKFADVHAHLAVALAIEGAGLTPAELANLTGSAGIR